MEKIEIRTNGLCIEEGNEMTKKLNQIEARKNMQDFEESFELRCDIYKTMAREFKVLFDAYVSEGFTPEQALEIIKARGTSLAQ